MRRTLSGALGALVAAAIMAAASAAPAGAQTSGKETINAVILASGASGARKVVSSVVVARGVFNGIGRLVEIDNLPGDPDNVLRDDLVFAGGSIHLLSTVLDASFSLDPRTCVFTVKVQQTGSANGGTGRFAAASGTFAGTVDGKGLLRRNPDGSCSQDQTPLLEVDTISSTGSLSF